MSVHGFLGYQYYNVLCPGACGVGTATCQSYFAGLGANLNFGSFYVKPQVSYYQNGAVADWLGSYISRFQSRALSMISIPALVQTSNWFAVTVSSTSKI